MSLKDYYIYKRLQCVTFMYVDGNLKCKLKASTRWEFRANKVMFIKVSYIRLALVFVQKHFGQNRTARNIALLRLI